MSFYRDIGYSFSYINNIAKRVNKHYKCYWQEKRGGGSRQIEAPGKELKTIQKWILRNRLEKMNVHECAHGFVRGKSIKTNARVHLGNTKVLCMDLRNFFPSITKQQVKLVLKSNGLQEQEARIISMLCCYKNRLSQGGVCSPYLSNLIMCEHDESIKSYCSTLAVEYSRYADDLTFSSMETGQLQKVEKFINELFEGTRFEINDKKTRYMTGANRVSITGININNRDKLTITWKQKTRLKTMLHHYFIKKLEVNVNEMLGLYRHIIDVQPTYKENLNSYIAKLKLKAGND